MEENQYRDTYHRINPLRCVFEKSINSRRCHCSLSHRFCLADREGVSCTVELAQKRCQSLLDTLRSNATFAVHLTRIDGALPHGKEVKVQNGGLLGLQQLLKPDCGKQSEIADIQQLINLAIEEYGSIEALPYDEIIKQVASFEGRSRRRAKEKNRLE